MHDNTAIPSKVQGKVLLYDSRNTAEPPFMTMWRDITSNLPTILQGLSGRYSPIKSMLLLLLFLFVFSIFF